MVGRYRVVTLCGSTRFKEQYARSNGKDVMYLDEVG